MSELASEPGEAAHGGEYKRGAVLTGYCAWCGKAETGEAHERCRDRLSLVDPPRYCVECARRMVVQVTPSGWSARCSRHGARTSTPG